MSASNLSSIDLHEKSEWDLVREGKEREEERGRERERYREERQKLTERKRKWELKKKWEIDNIRGQVVTSKKGNEVNESADVNKSK